MTRRVAQEGTSVKMWCSLRSTPQDHVLLLCPFYFSVFTSKSISPGRAEEGELVPKAKGLLEYVCVL